MGIDNLIKDSIGIAKANKLNELRIRKSLDLEDFDVSIDINIYRNRVSPYSSSLNTAMSNEMPEPVKDAKNPK